MKKNVLTGTVVAMGIALASFSFICGSKKKNVTIYHQNDEGNWVVISVSKNALATHAAHGDLYYSTLCPLSGAENACR